MLTIKVFTMKAIIVDDETKARKMLHAMLNDLCPEVEVMEECDDLPNAVKAIKRLSPQLVFLDIEMPGHSGLELLEFFSESEIDFQIVFTTAYDHYAIKAFKLSAVDYLLKPISPTELKQAVLRVSKREVFSKDSLFRLKENLQPEGTKKLVIPQLNGFRFIDHSDILYLKGERAYATIWLKDGSTILASRNLKYFEDLLMLNTAFFRCHRSFLVNLNHVKEFVRTDGGNLILQGGKSVSVASERIQPLLDRLGQ